MHIVLVDDSIPFDGYSPSSQPLGGAEKAFASLPGALARRGHRVQVFNRGGDRFQIEGASWETWQGAKPTVCDVLIAYRKPELLGFVPVAKYRTLWLAGSAAFLADEHSQVLLRTHAPSLVFMSEAHGTTYAPVVPDLTVHVVPPGIRSEYLDPMSPGPTQPPYAVATSHPSLGLDWLIRLWVARVHPQCPHASLRVYSAVLDRALLGGEVPGPFKAVAALALGAQDKGIVIHRPAADFTMADAYTGARAHLYPGDAREVYCYTLTESQACGVPAVARPFPATADCVADDVSGHLTASEDEFARRITSLLEDDAAYARLGEAARARMKGRDWDSVAAAFEAIWR